MDDNEFCECGCQDSELVRREALRRVCAFLVDGKHDDDEDSEQLMVTLRKVSFCCTSELRSQISGYDGDSDILKHDVNSIRKDMQRICERIVDDHKSCSPKQCKKSTGSMTPLHYYKVDSQSTDNSESDQNSSSQPSDEELYRVACELFDNGFFYFHHPMRGDNEECITVDSPNDLYLRLRQLSRTYQTKLVALHSDQIVSSDGFQFAKQLHDLFEDEEHGVLPVRNMANLQMNDEYLIFLFPQQFTPLSSLFDHQKTLLFDCDAKKLWFFAQLFHANTKALNPLIEGFVSGCSPVQSYFHFLLRFSYLQFTFLENMIQLAPFDEIPNYLVNGPNGWTIRDCEAIIRTATLELLRQPKFVVSALREWYRVEQKLTTPNGRTFNDALAIARKLSTDPMFAKVSGEVKAFLDSEEWTRYPTSNEVLFAPLTWGCECKEGFEHGNKLGDDVKLKLIPSLQRLEPELTAKMTDEELLEEVNDTLFKVHPCVQHVLPMVVRQYITLCPYIVDSFLEYLRNMRDVHSPWNVAVAMWLCFGFRYDVEDEVQLYRFVDLCQKANALELQGYPLARENTKELLNRPELQRAIFYQDIVPYLMVPCRHEGVVPMTFDLLTRIACKIIFTASIKCPIQLTRGASYFRGILYLLIRLPRCLVHHLEALLHSDPTNAILRVFDSMQRMATDKRLIKAARRKFSDEPTVHFRKGFIRLQAKPPSIKDEAAATRKRERQEQQRQKEARELEERRARQKTKKVDRSAPRWMEPPAPISEPTPHPMSSLPVEIPKEVFPPPISCAICFQQGNDLIHPRKEVYIKLKCYNACSHSIALHKTCFKAAFDGKRKKEIKNAGLCPVKHCGAKMESIYEVDMDRELTETLFLKWEPPVVHESNIPKRSSSSTSKLEKASATKRVDLELPTEPEKQEPQPEIGESEKFCFKQDVRRSALSTPPLPLCMADFAVRLEKKTAESVEKYATVDGMSPKTKKPRQRQQKETINLADLTGSSIARVPGRRVVGADGFGSQQKRHSRRGRISNNALTESEAAQSSNPIHVQPNPLTALSEVDDEVQYLAESDSEVCDFDPCSICIEPLFLDDEDVTECRWCKQYIHRKCVEQWLIKEQSCPMCRANWPSDEQFPPLR